MSRESDLSGEPADAENRLQDADLELLRRRLAAAVARACPAWLADDVDDLIQTALIRLVELVKKSEGGATFSSTYLARAAHGVVVDEIRRRCRRREYLARSEKEDPLPRARSNQPDPEREGVSREIAQGIRDCLAQLRRPRRLAVTLYLRGCSVPETGRRLQWDRKRAENLVFRGLADLRKCLDGKGVTP